MFPGSFLNWTKKYKTSFTIQPTRPSVPISFCNNIPDSSPLKFIFLGIGKENLDN